MIQHLNNNPFVKITFTVKQKDPGESVGGERLKEELRGYKGCWEHTITDGEEGRGKVGGEVSEGGSNKQMER